MGKIIGIDLGTTNSLVAVWEEGESKLIPNAFGELLTPSVVSVGRDGTLYVGKTAKERMASFPGDTAAVFKRFMGTGRKYSLGGKQYLPEELSAMVLRKLKEDAERYLGQTVEEAIISVPAYFSDMARTATKRAGALAGLKVERIINEPSAAALACHRIQEEDRTFLVFDFGGGTLDVSLVECFDNVVEIIAVSGDNQLGGQDFDDLLGTWFIRSLNLDPSSLTTTTRALIRRSAEKCKRELTVNKTAQMVVNCEQVNGQLEISRKDVVTVCASLFERMGKPIRQVMMDAKITAEGIDQVILVGGSCKMPVVRQYLQHLLQHGDMETMNPDHMIALGCGVCAGIKEREENIKDTLLTDICPFSLGTGIHNEEMPEKSLMSFIIPRNSPLPTSREQTYVTVHDRQKSLKFCVYQGEAMYAEDNIKLGELEVKIPPRPAGQVSAKLRYTYDINGILEVDIHIPITGEKRRLLIVNKELGFTQEQINAKLEEYKRLKIHPSQEEENQYVLAWGERLYMQCGSEMREELLRRMQYFAHVMEHDVYQVAKVRKYLMVYFAYLERQVENFIGWEQQEVEDGSWYEDEEEAEIDNLFKQWDEEDRNE